MKKSELAKEMADILLRIKRTRPLIHCITNYVNLQIANFYIFYY